GLWASPSRLPARSRGEHRTASADCPRNRLMFTLRSRGFQMQKRQEIERSRMNQSSPKAEVRGSNPFGRANYFNNLLRKCKTQFWLSKQVASSWYRFRFCRGAASFGEYGRRRALGGHFALGVGTQPNEIEAHIGLAAPINFEIRDVRYSPKSGHS